MRVRRWRDRPGRPARRPRARLDRFGARPLYSARRCDPVKFEFQNLGTIKKTTLDLRPLTVVLGPNNTSKTYLAYCVHGLMTSLREWHAAIHLGGKSEVEFQLSELKDDTQRVLQQVSRRFVAELPEYFQDTYGGLFRGTNLGILVERQDVLDALAELMKDDGIPLVLRGERVVLGDVGSDAKATMLGALAGFLVTTLPGALASFTLPAERNALVITYKLLSTRRYRVFRDRARRVRPLAERLARLPGTIQPGVNDQRDIGYPAPIEDFLDFLTDVELQAARPQNDPQSSFGKLANLIEHHIQGGHRTSYEATKLGGQELTVTVDKQTTLDLYNASSSIKQITPLLLYLRYRAAPNQTLIIDEPEMNLHPEGQAKLLEALGMLANLGVRILLTTHSPYFMAHLNNLIASDRASPARRKRQATHLYMGDPAAFLSPDDVSAYEMRPSGLTSLADPEYGIRWDTLSDVSAELQRRYFAIVEEPKRRAKTA